MGGDEFHLLEAISNADLVKLSLNSISLDSAELIILLDMNSGYRIVCSEISFFSFTRTPEDDGSFFIGEVQITKVGSNEKNKLSHLNIGLEDLKYLFLDAKYVYWIKFDGNLPLDIICCQIKFDHFVSL